MSTDAMAEFRSPRWRDLLRRYSKGLLDTLEHDLSGYRALALR